MWKTYCFSPHTWLWEHQLEYGIIGYIFPINEFLHDIVVRSHRKNTGRGHQRGGVNGRMSPFQVRVQNGGNVAFGEDLIRARDNVGTCKRNTL